MASSAAHDVHEEGAAASGDAILTMEEYADNERQHDPDLSDEEIEQRYKHYVANMNVEEEGEEDESGKTPDAVDLVSSDDEEEDRTVSFDERLDKEDAKSRGLRFFSVIKNKYVYVKVAGDAGKGVTTAKASSSAAAKPSKGTSLLDAASAMVRSDPSAGKAKVVPPLKSPIKGGTPPKAKSPVSASKAPVAAAKSPAAAKAGKLSAVIGKMASKTAPPSVKPAGKTVVPPPKLPKASGSSSKRPRDEEEEEEDLVKKARVEETLNGLSNKVLKQVIIDYTGDESDELSSMTRKGLLRSCLRLFTLDEQ